MQPHIFKPHQLSSNNGNISFQNKMHFYTKHWVVCCCLNNFVWRTTSPQRCLNTAASTCQTSPSPAFKQVFPHLPCLSRWKFHTLPSPGNNPRQVLMVSFLLFFHFISICWKILFDVSSKENGIRTCVPPCFKPSAYLSIYSHKRS